MFKPCNATDIPRGIVRALCTMQARGVWRWEKWSKDKFKWETVKACECQQMRNALSHHALIHRPVVSDQRGMAWWGLWLFKWGNWIPGKHRGQVCMRFQHWLTAIWVIVGLGQQPVSCRQWFLDDRTPFLRLSVRWDARKRLTERWDARMQLWRLTVMLDTWTPVPGNSQQLGQTEMPGRQIHGILTEWLQQVQDTFERDQWQTTSDEWCAEIVYQSGTQSYACIWTRVMLWSFCMVAQTAHTSGAEEQMWRSTARGTIGKDINHLHKDLSMLWGLTRLGNRNAKPT